jgi:hypothetical protein
MRLAMAALPESAHMALWSMLLAWRAASAAVVNIDT